MQKIKKTKKDTIYHCNVGRLGQCVMSIFVDFFVKFNIKTLFVYSTSKIHCHCFLTMNSEYPESLERSDKTVSRLACHRFSQKMSKRVFFAFLLLTAKKRFVGSFVFWDNLRCANLLTVLSDLYNKCNKSQMRLD